MRENIEMFENRIICGDCIEVMSRIPDQSIDMILCDLPYGQTAQNEWDKVIPYDLLWKQYRRIIKENAAIVLNANEPFASELISSNCEMFRYDLIWKKNRKTGFLNANKMPLRAHEMILVFYKKLPVYNPQKTFGHKPVNSFTKHTSDGTNYGKTQKGIKGGGQTDRHPTSVIEIAGVDNYSKKRLHPTQKPVALCEYLVKTYTHEGMLVLDNCVGSGTTAIACMNLGRRFVGIEKYEDIFQIAQNRVQQHEKKCTLGDPSVRSCSQ